MRLKIGIIGLSHPHANGHLRTLQLMEEVEEIYLAEEDPEILERFKHQEKITGSFSDSRQLLKRDDIPLVQILDRNDNAPSMIIQALEAEKHIITDKPAARTFDELAPVVELAEKKRLMFGVHYTRRWQPPYRESLRLRRAGALGRIVSAEFRVITTSVKSRDPRHWLFNRKIAGGGILHWLGCHDIDMLRYITGEEVVSVSAICSTLSGEDIDVEDVASVSLELSNGAIATIHAGYLIQADSKSDVLPHIEVPFAMRGTSGQIWLESGNGDPKLILQSVAPGWNNVQHHSYSYTMKSSEAYGGIYGIDFVRQFFKAAFGKGDPPVTGKDALKVLQITDAVYKSNSTGSAVKI